MSDRDVIRAFMAGLVARVGGVEPAAAYISARTGAEVSKGSVSKRLAGTLSWPIEEVWALEDAVGDPCVTRWRARALPGAAEHACLMRGAAVASRESGEGVAAVMDFVAGKRDRASARKEMADAIQALQLLGAALDSAGEGGE